jgi:penicillin-binding protein 1A
MAKKEKNNTEEKSELSKRGRLITIIFTWCFFSGPLVFLLFYIWLLSFGDLPSTKQLEDPKSNLASEIYTADGVMIGKYFRQNRSSVEYNELSPYLVACLVATEDERYYEHSGVDFWALTRVVKGVVQRDQSSGGGSTISQQLAKMLFPREKMSGMQIINRKFKEWIIATRLERAYTKEEIITMYLNEFDFINNAVGIKSAARVYFNTTPDSLRLEQSAMLVGMAKNPSLYNPKRDSVVAKQRRNVVLYQLLRNSGKEKIKALLSSNKVDRKYPDFTQADYERLCKSPLGLHYTKVDHAEGMAPYFREELRKDLEKMFDKKNADGSYVYHKKDGSKYDIYKDGLKIYVTLDSRMQRYAEYAVQEHLSKELQKAFDKDNKRWKNAPFSNDIKEEKIEEIMESARRKSARGQIMTGKKCGYCERPKDYIKTVSSGGNKFYQCTYCGHERKASSESEFQAAFEKKTKMTIFSWKKKGYEFDTLMTPNDSIRYYKRFLQAGMISIEPQTGFIKAWVGGINFKHFQYDHVRAGTRQVGSTFKPFVYAAAFRERVFDPCSEILDIEHCIDIAISPTKTRAWCPSNAGSAYSGALTPLYFALAASMNNITAAIIKQLKAPNVIKLVEDLGIPKGYLDPVPSICLGSCDLSVYQMTGAQAAFANKGIFIKPILFTRIEDRYGNVIYDVEPVTNEAMDEETAFMMLSIMKGTTSGVINPHTGKAGGTASRIRSSGHPYGGLKTPIAGKTGTTQNQSDGWFIGLTPDLVTGVWVGCEDRSVRFSTVSLGMGTNMALPMWGYYMKKVYADKSLKISQGDFEAPEKYKAQDCRDYVGGMDLWKTIDLREVEMDIPVLERPQDDLDTLDFFNEH